MHYASKRKISNKVILTRSKFKEIEEEKKSVDDINEVDKKPVVQFKEYVMNNKTKDSIENNEYEDEEEEEEEEGDGNPFAEYPELEKMMNEPKVKEMFDYFEKELKLVDETPEERKKYEENPYFLVIMRNTASSNMMQELIACWIKEVKEIKLKKNLKEPDAVFQKLFALTFAVFIDDYWICDHGQVEVVYFLVHEIAKIWKWLLAQTDKILKISKVLRTELCKKLKVYAIELKLLSKDWLDHPIEFILSKTKLKYKIECYTLDEIVHMGKEVRRIKMQTYEEFDRLMQSNKN